MKQRGTSKTRLLCFSVRAGAPPTWNKYNKPPEPRSELLNSSDTVACQGQVSCMATSELSLTLHAVLVTAMRLEIVYAGQGFSSSAPLTSWAKCCGGCPRHYGMFSNIPGLHPPSCDKNTSRCCRMSPGGQHGPPLRNAALEIRSFLFLW